MTKSSWDVYWSPEGRKIATVEAVSESAAIRLAPQPYRKCLGEMYAKRTPNSFRASVVLYSDGLLLGGGRYHQSSAFSAKKDAETWALQCVATNKGRPGYETADIGFETEPVYCGNPIPAAV